MDREDPRPGRLLTGPWKTKCTANTSGGRPCKRWAIKGGTVCPTHGGSAPLVIAAAKNRREEMLDRLWGIAPEFIDRMSQIAADVEVRTVATADGNTAQVIVPRSADADVVRATKVILDKLLPTRVVDETGAQEERDLDAEIGELVRDMDADEVKRRLARLGA
jgi:hypothetical protein